MAANTSIFVFKFLHFRTCFNLDICAIGSTLHTSTVLRRADDKLPNTEIKQNETSATRERKKRKVLSASETATQMTFEQAKIRVFIHGEPLRAPTLLCSRAQVRRRRSTLRGRAILDSRGCFVVSRKTRGEK